MRHAFGLGLARQLNFAGRGEKTGIGGMIVTAVIVRKFNFCMNCCQLFWHI